MCATNARDGRSRRGRCPGRRRSGGDRDGRGTTTGRGGWFRFPLPGWFRRRSEAGARWGETGTETHPHAAKRAPRVNVTSAKPSMKDNSGAAPSRADIAGSGEHARGHAARTNAIIDGGEAEESNSRRRRKRASASEGPGGVSDRPEICSCEKHRDWSSIRTKYFSLVDLVRLCERSLFLLQAGRGAAPRRHNRARLVGLRTWTAPRTTPTMGKGLDLDAWIAKVRHRRLRASRSAPRVARSPLK